MKEEKKEKRKREKHRASGWETDSVQDVSLRLREMSFLWWVFYEN